MPLFNPDPNYRDPDFEKRLVPEQGSVEALDVLNAPPPGHSLTDDSRGSSLGKTCYPLKA